MRSLLLRLQRWKLSRRKTLVILIFAWLIVTFMIYTGFVHVQHEHAHPNLLSNPFKIHAITEQIKRSDLKNYKSSGLLSFELMLRSTILVDPVSQFYQSVFPSLLAFWNENISNDLVLILDDDRYFTTYWMDDDARETLQPILNVVFKKEALPKYWNKLYLTGYDRQQYSTLQLDTHSDKDILIMLDTDSPFIVMPTREDFVDDATNRVKLVASNIYGGDDRQHDWSVSCKLLFDDQFLIDGMTMLPQVYHRSTLINFRNFFTEVMRREYHQFVTQYMQRNPHYPGLGMDNEFDIEATSPLNNTDMDRTILYALHDPNSTLWSFDDAFMFFAQNFSNKPYSEYTLLMNYAYLYEHDKYEWHIDNWNIAGENTPHHRVAGHWKYAKPETEKSARITCCHLYFDHQLETLKHTDDAVFSFCDANRDEYPNLNNFMEDWFEKGTNRYSISPQFSDDCDNEWCQNAKRFERDDENTKERYQKMRDMVNPEHQVFSAQSLETKYTNCLNITRLKMNQVYQYIRLRHKGKHGQLPTPSFHHRNAFRHISGGKY